MKLKKPKESKITMEEFAKLCAEPIDWEQRRYEIAKDAYLIIVGTIEKAVAEGKTDRENLDYYSMAYDAISYANVLIEQLQLANEGKEIEIL